MKRKIDKNLFAKYYWGLTTEKENKEVFESEESETMMKNEWDNFQLAKKKEISEFNQEKIKLEIDRRISAGNKWSKNLTTSFIRLSKYAAAILIPLFMAGLVYYLGYYQDNNNVSWVEKQSLKGEKLEFSLPDGSIVWLNSDSKLSYPEKFTGETRQVSLDGEAYFEVIHQTSQPFIVSTSKLDIKVLGTSFNVRSYLNDKTISTTLVTGKVSVQRLNPKTNKVRRAILSPNQQAVFYKETEDFVLDKVDINKFTLWRQGKLVIEGKSFKELANELERWFDVDINLQKSLYTKYSYTITITDETIENVMDLLKRTTPSLTIKYEGKHIYISEK